MFNKCSILKKMCSLKFFVAFISIIIIVNETAAYSQSAGGIIGTVRELKSKNILVGVNIAVKGTGLGTATNYAGEYILTDLNPGSYILEFSSIGYEDIEITNVTVKAGENTRLDVVLRQEIITLADVTIVGASKRVEKITHAPAAISKINPLQIQQFAVTGQIPELLRSEPGIDIVENDVNDYNVNARGFNTSLNRRMLVLQDYRETAMAFLLAQEWNTFSLPIDDFAEVEVVRGPGSALYGANAFSGVMNIITPAPEKIKGTKVTLAGGELNSIRGDVRHAGFQGPWGYKFNVGAFRSDSWSKSRNFSQDMLDKNEYRGLEREFAPVNDEGLSTAYASLRTDYNFFNGSVATTEGGIAQAANQVFVTGIGRVQVSEVIRPWARLNYTSDKFFIQVDYNGRKTLSGHQIALNSLSVFKEDSYDIKAQFQNNFSFYKERFRFIWGGSHKIQYVDTKLTLTPDSYRENQSGLFGHLEFKLNASVSLIGATRVDRSTLHDTQVSPKAALVYSLNKNHNFRLTYNRAFQTPNYAEYFLQTTAGAAEDLAGLEQDIEVAVEFAENLPRGSVDLPLNFDLTPQLARGNANLEVEKVKGFEIGYKGQYHKRMLMTADLYYNRLTNFVTDLLPGVNPDYAPYQIPAEITGTRRDITNQYITDNIGRGFTTLADGSHAFVLSYTNAGKVDVWGMEMELMYQYSKEIIFRGNYSFFNFDVKDKAVGDKLLPNTPKHKFMLGGLYEGRTGVDVNLYLKYVDSMEWAAGLFHGPVPSYLIVNLAGGYKFDQHIRVGGVISNVFDNEHYEFFGGSVNGRRALLSMTYKF